MNAVITNVENLPVLDSREKLLAFESYLTSLPAEAKREFDTTHDFCPGIYARSIFMPAGTLFTSKIHKTRHFFVVTQGSCTVVDSFGNRKLIAAPYLGVTEPGTKRVLLIHEDCIWTTFHRTDLTDVAEIEKQLIAESFDTFDQEKS